MILVDTSAWIDFFRGSGPFGDRVDSAIAENEVALCGPIITEIRRGLKSVKDRERVIALLESCHFLEQPDDLWVEAGEIGFLLARRGMSVKTLDLLIAVHALSFRVPILTKDSDFRLMKQAGLGIELVP